MAFPRVHHLQSRHLVWLPLLVALLLSLTGCGPEGARSRGGPDNADSGNHASTIQLHGDQGWGQQIYFDTPNKQPVVSQ
jgi:hypothetical protein